VSQIYAVTEVFMMQDKSHDKQDTWDFLERRIQNAMTVGQFVNQNTSFVSAVSGGLMSILQGLVPPGKDDADILKQKK
jgi:ubiquinone biosynthesis protein COQ9